MFKKVLFFLSILFFLPLPVYAKLGVGVATGKIVVDDKLKPGMIYNLPVLTVLNTGDEEAEYEVGVSYHEKQAELRPKQEWFVFSPQKFLLKPGAGQKVEIKLNLPIKIEPGDYFAYLEGYPLKKSESGQTSVGIAAGTKLYFTVLPANPVLGAYYKAASLWEAYQPWSLRIAIILAVVIVYCLLHKYLGFQIGFKKKKKENQNE
jgi:hypothetical protein